MMICGPSSISRTVFNRFQALELKLRSVQEALELVLDVARDRRVFLLEIAVVVLFCLELVSGFSR